MKTVSIASRSEKPFSRTGILACVWWFFLWVQGNGKARVPKRSVFSPDISVTAHEHAKCSQASPYSRFYQGLGCNYLTFYQMDWLTQFYLLCLVPSKCSSYSEGVFLFCNRMNADKDGDGTAAFNFVYLCSRAGAGFFSGAGRCGGAQGASEEKPFCLPLPSELWLSASPGPSWAPGLPTSRLFGTKVTGLTPGLLHSLFRQGVSTNSRPRGGMGQLT